MGIEGVLTYEEFAGKKDINCEVWKDYTSYLKKPEIQERIMVYLRR